MIKDVRKGDEIDLVKIKSYLVEQKLLKKNDELKVFQFSNGFSNLTYLLQSGSKELVLRKPPKGAIKRGHDMGREYKVLSKLNQVFSKSPEVYTFEETGSIIGSPFYVMEKVEGIILTSRVAKELVETPKDFVTISNSWLDTFVELHALDYDAAGLSDLGRPEGYVERQVNVWSKQYLKSATQDIPEAEQVMTWMQEHQPKSYDHSLIHNDFKYDNVVFEKGNWNNITAVLDWEMCTLGDPLMDLGTSIAYWTMQSDGIAATMGIPSPTILDGNPSRTEIVQAYAEKSGRPVNNLVFYYVYGLFKIAVIVQQIFYRYDKGLTTNPKFANLDKVCVFLCKMAKLAIDKKKIDNLF